MIVDSPEAMADLGFRIGEKLKVGDVVLLKGELGAGKTTLARGVGRALGVDGVTSPTFVISKIYQGRVPLIHVDAYRLIGNPLATFDDLDLESRIPTSITLIEWGGGFIERIVDFYIEVAIDFVDGSEQRVVTISGLEI